MNPVYRTALNYGALSGISSFIVFLALYFMGHNPLGKASWLGAWIPIVFIVAGILHYRNHEQDGYITYGHALVTGLYISIATGFLFGLLVYIFGSVIDSSIVDAQLNEALEGMEQAKKFMGDEWYEKTMTQLQENKDKFTIGSIVFNDFIAKIIGGVIVSLIVAGFLRKPKPFFEQEEETHE